MKLDEYCSYDALTLAKLVKEKEVSPRELITCALEKIREANGDLNAVVRTYETSALQEAETCVVDEKPFSGVPILLKDISQKLAGQKITCGSKLLEENIATFNSHFVERMLNAGFIVVGHTNTPEFGLRNITENEIYGSTRNPFNLAFSPGGSSGGSAAAVASGIVPMAGASDGGGSIRIPASFTGLFGLKPTRGRISVGPGFGRQWHGAAIDFCLSRTVQDSAAMFDIQSVYQPEAAFYAKEIPGKMANLMRNPFPKKLRIGFTTESPVKTPVSTEAKEATLKLVRFLEAEGHDVEEVKWPVDGIDLIKNYYLMNCGEMASDLMWIEEYLGRKIQSHEVDIVAWALFQVGQNLNAVEFTRSLAEWDTAAFQMEKFHNTYDFFITPSTASTAPKVGELMQNNVQVSDLLQVNELPKPKQLEKVYEMFLPSLSYTPFTQIANLTGQPAMSLPVGVSAAGLPIGVQVIAPKGREDRLFQLAWQLEQTKLWMDSTKILKLRGVV